jgi:hypothetical protein
LFVALVVASCIIVNWVVIPTNPEAYQAAKLDKLALLEQTDSPKVILVGGSNLAFSINSAQLEAHVQRPVVNMGLAKSVGLNYLLREVDPFIEAGDLVIVAPEYELFYDLFRGSDGLVVELQHNPAGIRHIRSYGEWRMLLVKFGPILQMKVNAYLRRGSTGLVDSVYVRSGFDENGDLVTHLDAAPVYKRHDLFPEDKPFADSAIRLLERFVDDQQRKGATVVITYAPLIDEEFSANLERIQKVDNRLREAGLPVVSRPADYVFTRTDMFDTPYHLQRAARNLRTQLLIRDLDTASLVDSHASRTQPLLAQ